MRKRTTPLLLASALLVLAPLALPAGADPLPIDTASGLGSSQRAILLPGGLSLEFEQRGLESGRPVIFLHGYADSWYSFARIAPLLPPEVRAYFLSQRGHGNSGKPACCYAPADFAGDLLAFMDAKRIERATLVGHGLGSFVAQRFAIDYPERVDALVLTGSAAIPGNAALVGFDAEVQELTAIDRPFVDELRRASLCVPVPEEFLSGVIDESLKVPLAVWKSALHALVDPANDGSRLGEIAVPTLVIGGKGDGFFTPIEQFAAARLIGRGSFQLYEGLCHAPHWEAPARFTEDLLQFLRKNPPVVTVEVAP